MNNLDATWEGVLQLLDPRQPISKRSNSLQTVEVWREWDVARERAVWSKRYLTTAEYSLDAFNRAELEWLMLLASSRVAHTYRSSYFERSGTLLAKPSSYIIKTDHCGPTLNDWLRTPVRVSGQLQAHCLVQPEAYLRMVLNVLQALQCIHACNFIHCDLHTGNICLPALLVSHGNTFASIKPDWDELTLIDFGYAINAKSAPRTTLPLKHSEGARISPLLKSILSEVESHALTALASGEQWASVMFDPGWWQRLETSPLDAFRRLDWREDLYQLGRMLADVRDGVGEAHFLGGKTLRVSKAERVNQLVAELPEHLMELGSAASAQEKPHNMLIESVQQALNQSSSLGQRSATTLEIRQIDYENSAAKFDPNETPMGLPVQKHTASKARTADTLTVGQAFRDAPFTPEMMVLPSGDFIMGSSINETGRNADEGPQRKVRINQQIAVSKYLVTFDDWKFFTDDEGLKYKIDDRAWGRGRRPVMNVSWFDAQCYIDWLNAKMGFVPSDPFRYRLPSEAEWEYACKAGTRRMYSTLDGHMTPERANYDTRTAVQGFSKAGRNLEKTSIVGAYPANPWGLHDMHGNLWEWVQDGYESDYKSMPMNGAAIEKNNKSRVVRGGSWNSDLTQIRSSCRSRMAPDSRTYSIGFRLARTLCQ